MNQKNEIISIPLETGAVQRIHKLIEKYNKSKEADDLRFLAGYLELKRDTARTMDYEDHMRDANVLDDLGKLALECLNDIEQEDKNY